MRERGHIIVGTAGHVDHGKTLLTAALTGIDTDRLPEEKKRGMTIVPGFVPLDLKSGRRLGLIDVPGHEKFVKNMLAGVAGVDMVMLVIAADESVMPQTVEHLNIINLLDIDKGVICITKSDMVDEEWIEMVKDDVAELVKGTSLENAPVIEVSAHTGHNIDKLRDILDEVAATVPERPSAGYCRIPVDRVFNKTGFGTIITGTLWMGSISEGQRLEMLPGETEVRVRGIQVHEQPVEKSYAGQRTALNIAGPEVEKVHPGSWLAEPGLLRETYRIDVSLRLLKSAKAITQRKRVRVHHGTREALGRVHLLDREELKPGESCLCQLVLETPLPPLRGDKMILRAYSPMVTVAGATVLDPTPPRRKRYNQASIEELSKKQKWDLSEVVLDVLHKADKPLNVSEIANIAQMPASDIKPVVEQFDDSGRISPLNMEGEPVYMLPERQDELLDATLAMVGEYHKRSPLRKGMPLAELKQKVFPSFTKKQMGAMLDSWKQDVRTDGANISAADFKCEPRGKDAERIRAIMKEFSADPFSPPEWADVISGLGISKTDEQEYLTYLSDSGKLVKAGPISFSGDALAQAEQKLRELGEQFTIGEARDALGTSRKYVQAILEYFDAKKLTIRQGDYRRFLK